MYLVAVNLDNPREMAVTRAQDGRPVRIGRRPESLPEDETDALRITWNDRLVSRNHCVAVRSDDTLSLERLPALTGRSNPNALYSNAAPRDREVLAEPVELHLGDSAMIGTKGTTAIYWLESLAHLESEIQRHRERLEAEHEADYEESPPLTQQGYEEMDQLDDYSLRLQLKLLQKELPEQVLSGWTDEEDLFTRASTFLENALPGQKGVSAVFVALDRIGESVEFEVLNPDPLARADFRPSRTLLGRVDLEAPTPSDVHTWTSREDRPVFRADSLGDHVDWVSIVPVARFDESSAVYRDQSRRPVYLYVETRQASETAATAFLPFLRLISSIVASLLSARADQKLQDQMAAYFSPGLRRLMRRRDQSVLEPAMVDCTVMFADRRGHSRMLELAHSDEEILDRLHENQGVVGLITEEVFRAQGVITDFAGDGALGLWGWPNFEHDPRAHALEAVEAAEAIVERLAGRVIYEEEQARDMAAVRIGISTGRIAVGRTGPNQQWHISVFGGVANLGARLERIAKDFRVPVLVSDETHRRIAENRERRFRKLCHIRPAGFQESYPIYELVLPKSLGGSEISEADAGRYVEALGHFHSREWDATLDILDALPADDPPTAWLRDKTLALRHDPPDENWGGEIESLTK